AAASLRFHVRREPRTYAMFHRLRDSQRRSSSSFLPSRSSRALSSRSNHKSKQISCKENRMTQVKLTLFVLLIALAPVSLFAQSSNGSISGTVTDGSGAALPGVTITATSTSTGVARTGVSNSAGHYEIALLPPATYDLAADLSGFQPLKREKI